MTEAFFLSPGWRWVSSCGENLPVLFTWWL